MKRRVFVRSGLAAAMGTSIPLSPSGFRLVRQEPADVDAITGDGAEVTLRGRAVKALSDRLRGRLLLAHDDGYEQARHILNPSFDKRPALIAQVTGTADVRTAVEFAREYSLLTAVKCGGHSYSGKSTCDGGIMIDLSPFRHVRVDPVARRARVTGGSLLGQLDHEAMAYDLVTPMGTVSHTGVGGLVTGGGFGRLARRYGLAIDNLTSVDVVTADGEFRRADEEQHPDLFWGVRGAGGNFGIVTSFEFKLHPMQRQVIAGSILFPISRAREVLAFYADFAPGAPDELQLDFMMLNPQGDDRGVVGFNVCYAGLSVQANRALAPVRSLGATVIDDVQPIDYVALQRSGDSDDPRARGTYLKSGFIPGMTPELAAAMAEGMEGHPARTTVVFIQQSGGAIGRVPNDAMAFAHREAAGNMLALADWAFGADPTDHIAYIRQYWSTLEPHTRGFYTNDLDFEATAESVNANYRENYPRLVEIKKKYDPTNLFRLNANVQPG